MVHSAMPVGRPHVVDRCGFHFTLPIWPTPSPEWYFLALYAILRSIPNKHAGVAAVALVIVTLVLLGGR